jgi:predicted pyridoxine 5'-phosphate oxidase superfamily flavin-nucleotide-binding protein
MMVQPRLDGQFAAFLQGQMFVIVASSTPVGQVWASVLVGPPGFAVATAPDHVIVRAAIADEEPLAEALDDGPAAIGLLVIDPLTRGRIRLNGTGTRGPDGLELDLSEVFGNCPKYIQRRVPTRVIKADTAAGVRSGTHLDQHQRAFVEAADTFFIASRHPGRGADASHRGGRPGFVVVAADGRSLTFPDYQGNNMFQTLGNLTVNPATGLLFIDWDTGGTLQITGRADIIWEVQRRALWPGAERLVEVHVDAVIGRAHGSVLHWELVETHHLNPPVPPRG